MLARKFKLFTKIKLNPIQNQFKNQYNILDIFGAKIQIILDKFASLFESEDSPKKDPLAL